MRMHLPQLIYDSKGLWENNEHTKPRVNRRKDAISYLMGLCDSSVQWKWRNHHHNLYNYKS